MTNPQNKTIDRIDRNILVELQKNARLSNVELSKRVGLSPTPCLERVKRLEKEQYITGFQAILNPQKLEAALLVIVEITVAVAAHLHGASKVTKHHLVSFLYFRYA